MIYLDSAATTLQKPRTVPQAMQAAATRYASPGRGGYPAAMGAAEVLFTCRELAAELFHAPGSEQVIFTSNATMALNIAIRSLVRPGMTVVVSGYEHNAVTRCVSAIPDVTVLVAEGELFQPEQLVRSYQKWMNRADVAICNAVSNVFGYCLPVADIAALCRRSQVPLIVDASQAAGCLPVDMAAWGAAYVAMPGHKSLYGPQGTGILLCAADANPTPLLYGGTGSQSRDQAMPDFLPDRLEAGTENVPGVAGLLEGMRFVRQKGTGRILRHERQLTRWLGQTLRQMERVEVFLAEDAALQTGVLSFRVDGMDCEEVGQRLSQAGIAVRTGLHCAPFAHRSAGTLETGTVRVSTSAFNNQREVEQTARVLRSFL